MDRDARRAGLVGAHIRRDVVDQQVDVEPVGGPEPGFVHQQGVGGHVVGQLRLEFHLAGRVEHAHHVAVDDALGIRRLRVHVHERRRVDVVHPVEVLELRVQAVLGVRREQPQRRVRLASDFVLGQRRVAVGLRRLGLEFVLARRRRELQIRPRRSRGQLGLGRALAQVFPRRDPEELVDPVVELLDHHLLRVDVLRERARAGLFGVEHARERRGDLDVGLGLEERLDGLFVEVHPVVPVRDVDGPVLERRDRRQHDVGLLDRRVEEQIDGHDQLELLEGLEDLVLVEVLADHVLVGDPQQPDRRILRVEDLLRDLVDVDGAVGVAGRHVGALTGVELALGACRAGVADGAFRRGLDHGVVVEAPCEQVAVARAAAGLADVAGHRHQRVDRADIGAAVDMALHAVADPDRGGVRRRELLGHTLDHVDGQAGLLGSPLDRDVGLDVGLELVVAEAVGRDPLTVDQARVDQVAGHAERQRAVGAGLHLPVLVALDRGLREDGVDHHDLGAALLGFVDVLERVHRAVRGVRAPNDDVLALDHVLGVVAPHVAHVVVLGVDAGRPARRTDEARGVAQRRHHAFDAVVRDPEVARVLGQRHAEERAVLGLDLQDLVGDGVEGFIPGDALPLARAAPDLAHRILDPVRAVDRARIGVAFHAQAAVGEGRLGRALDELEHAILHVADDAAGVVAVAWAGVAEGLIGVKPRERRAPKGRALLRQRAQQTGARQGRHRSGHHQDLQETPA